jgi:hypothetical protein
MAELMLDPQLAAIAKRNAISADDVLNLRSTVYKDGVSSPAEVESLFALDGACQDKAAEWAVFMIEATCDYVVHQEKPEGYLSEQNAAWLQGLIARDGRMDGKTELDLMIRVMEAARSVPAAFSDYVLSQTHNAVCDASGSLFAQDGEGRMRITGQTASTVRRVLYAMGGQGNIAVTRAEAELMFNINDKATSPDNDPAWNDLFVKSIANFMMAASGYQTPNRERALAQDEFLNSAGTSGLGGFFSRMMEGTFANPSAWLKSDSIEDRFAERNKEMEHQSSEAERVTGEEAQWLAGRIGHDGRMGANERALVEFIKAESPSLHPEFQKLAAKVA